jgi:pimeloyl-ACP methyl ester carboxylesterase
MGRWPFGAPQALTDKPPTNRGRAPARIAMEQIAVNGISLAFTKTGDGPPLVLMHGNEADHSMFDALVGRLGGSFTVYAYDQRDCGLTENPGSGYTLPDLGDDAAAFIAALGLPRAHVYGSSLGGLVAQSLAARHPDRVDRLVLGNTWPAGERPGDFNPDVVSRLAAYGKDLANNAPDIAELFFPLKFIRERPAVVEMFRGSGRSPEKRARRNAIIQNSETVDLSGFPRRVLLLTGTEDGLIPPEVTVAIGDRVQWAEVVRLDGVGHVGVIQDPDQVARVLINFLLRPE